MSSKSKIKKLFRPSALLFYLLILLNFFLLGMFFAKWIGVAENQGLAAGAIVLGYGLIFSAVAFVLSLIIGIRVTSKTLIRLNLVLLITLLSSVMYVRKMQRNKEAQREEKPLPKTTTGPANSFNPGFLPI